MIEPVERGDVVFVLLTDDVEEAVGLARREEGEERPLVLGEPTEQGADDEGHRRVQRERLEEAAPDRHGVCPGRELRLGEEVVEFVVGGLWEGGREVELDGLREQLEGLVGGRDEGDVLEPPLHLPPLVALVGAEAARVAVERLMEDGEKKERSLLPTLGGPRGLLG